MHSAAANNSRMNADKEAKQFVQIWNLLKVKNKRNDTGWLEALNGEARTGPRWLSLEPTLLKDKLHQKKPWALVLAYTFNSGHSRLFKY